MQEGLNPTASDSLWCTKVKVNVQIKVKVKLCSHGES